MKKKLLIMILIIICAGCNADYKVKINDDLSVTETLSATEPKEYYEEYGNQMPGTIIASILSPYVDTLNENGYYTDTVINNSTGGIKTSKDYANIEEYAKNTIFSSQYSQDAIDYQVDGDIVTLSISGAFSHAEQDQTSIPVDTARITISLPFKVVEHNADSVGNNVYYWNYDEETGLKTIRISFNSKEKVTVDKPKTEIEKIKEKILDNKYLIFVVTGIIILSISGVILLFKKLKEKQEKANKI